MTLSISTLVRIVGIGLLEVMNVSKRFIPIFDGYDKRVVGAKDNGKIISFEDMFDLLNSMNNELSTYKSSNRTLQERLKEVTDENKELKQEIGEWKDMYYDSTESLIYETSSTTRKDIEKLHKEVYGDD